MIRASCGGLHGQFFFLDGFEVSDTYTAWCCGIEIDLEHDNGKRREGH
jgi:hypothetical protein